MSELSALMWVSETNYTTSPRSYTISGEQKEYAPLPIQYGQTGFVADEWKFPLEELIENLYLQNWYAHKIMDDMIRAALGMHPAAIKAFMDAQAAQAKPEKTRGVSEIDLSKHYRLIASKRPLINLEKSGDYVKFRLQGDGEPVEYAEADLKKEIEEITIK